MPLLPHHRQSGKGQRFFDPRFPFGLAFNSSANTPPILSASACACAILPGVISVRRAIMSSVRGTASSCGRTCPSVSVVCGFGLSGIVHHLHILLCHHILGHLLRLLEHGQGVGLLGQELIHNPLHSLGILLFHHFRDLVV